jgi:hypothetical protein
MERHLTKDTMDIKFLTAKKNSKDYKTPIEEFISTEIHLLNLERTEVDMLQAIEVTEGVIELIEEAIEEEVTTMIKIKNKEEDLETILSKIESTEEGEDIKIIREIEEISKLGIREIKLRLMIRGSFIEEDTEEIIEVAIEETLEDKIKEEEDILIEKITLEAPIEGTEEGDSIRILMKTTKEIQESIKEIKEISKKIQETSKENKESILYKNKMKEESPIISHLSKRDKKDLFLDFKTEEDIEAEAEFIMKIMKNNKS